MKSDSAVIAGSKVRLGSAATAGRAERTGGAWRLRQPWWDKPAQRCVGFMTDLQRVEKKRRHLKKLNVVLHSGEFVQLCLARFQLGDLFSHFFQEQLGLADGPLFLGFHQFSHLKAFQLNRPDQLRKDGVAVLGSRTCRALEEQSGVKWGRFR